ncbi:MAG: ATP-binding protein [Gemmatimonadales bacterium]
MTPPSLTRLVILVTTGTAILLVVLVANLLADLRKLRSVVDEDLPRRLLLDRTADELEINTLEFGIATLRVLLRDLPEDRQRAAREERELVSAIARYDSLTAGSGERADFVRIAGPTGEFRRLGRSLLETPSPAQTSVAPSVRPTLDSMIAFRQEIDRLLDTDIQVRAGAAVGETRQAAAGLSAGLGRLSAAGALLALAVPLVLVIGIRRAVIRPAASLTTAVARVADGDFAARTDPARAGDLEALAGGINRMTARLEELTAKNERLAEVGLLAAGVAHEVRNPLFAISSNLDAWQVGARDEPATGEMVERVRDEVTRLSTLMRDLLNYGRPAPLSVTVAPIDGPIVAAVRELEPYAARQRVGIRTELTSPAPNAKIDAGRLGQAIENVVRNAIAFTPEGGEVVVSSASTPAGVSVTVADGGPGFPSDQLDRVFQPFVSRRPGGTGLGLAIVSRIVEDLGGRASARNGPQGGIVTLELPRADA